MFLVVIIVSSLSFHYCYLYYIVQYFTNYD